MKVLFITNIPSPYRYRFFNELGKSINLDVLFEAKYAKNIMFDFDGIEDNNFNTIFLSDSYINEKTINFRIVNYLRKNRKKYDYIFVTNYGYLTEMMALFYLIISRTKYIIELDGGILKKESVIRNFVKRLIISNSQTVFSPSIKTDQFVKKYGFSKTIVRYPFTSLSMNDILTNPPTEADKSFYRDVIKTEHQINILFVGQLIYRKGLDILFEALNDERLSKIGIYVVGDSNDDEYKKLLMGLKTSNINFIGFSSKSELRKYYIACDIFVLPTREDVWGLVINEAIAHALPVVTTPMCGSGVEIIKHGYNGYIISDVHELRSALLKLVENKELREQFSKNSLLTAKKYTIEEMVESHLKYLKVGNLNEIN